MDLLRQKVLVLNRNCIPIGCCTVRRAITLLFKDGPAAYAIDEFNTFHNWDSWQELPPSGQAIHTPSNSFRIPEIIMVVSDHMPKFKIAYNRQAVFRRDEYRCYYCDVKFHKDDLSVDHIIPRCRGGKNAWSNCVTACKNCNFKKGDRTPEEAGMPLLRMPSKPQFLLCDPPYPTSWKTYLVN